MPYTPIVGTLIYIQDPLTSNVLLVHRIGRKNDEQLGKWNGLGGKLERNEDIVTSARRELFEESGLQASDLRLRGTISWPGFGPNGEDWFGFVFLVSEFTGTVPIANDEGPLEWVEFDRVMAACSDSEEERTASGLNFWDGDRYFLPLVFDGVTQPFHGLMPYSNGLPMGWSYVRL